MTPPMNRRVWCRTVLGSIFFLAFGCCLRAAEIHDAAAAGDLSAVGALLAADPALIEARTNDGVTPLMFAAQKGRLETVKLLLEEGANPNVAVEGWTALRVAEETGCTEIAGRLRKAGAK